MGIFGKDAQTTWSAAAITNDNPTWTERLDSVINAAEVDGGILVATAPASAATATGNWTATSSGTVTSGSVLLSLEEDTNATVTLDLATLAATQKALSITGNADVALDLATLAASPKEPTIAITARKYTATSKADTSPTIANTSKTGTATFSNTSKTGTATFTNTPKS